MNIGIDIQDKGLLATYAALKNVPLAKVLRNAARDFVQAAYRATPLARIAQSRYVRIPIEGTKKAYRYIPWDSLDEKGQERLKKRRIRLQRGWSRASWIRLMRILGMTNKNGDMRKERTGKRWEAVNRLATIGLTERQVEITDAIHFDARPGEIDRITEAGFALATKRISNDFKKIMKAAQEGAKPKL